MNKRFYFKSCHCGEKDNFSLAQNVNLRSVTTFDVKCSQFAFTSAPLQRYTIKCQTYTFPLTRKWLIPWFACSFLYTPSPAFAVLPWWVSPPRTTPTRRWSWDLSGPWAGRSCTLCTWWCWSAEWTTRTPWISQCSSVGWTTTPKWYVCSSQTSDFQPQMLHMPIRRNDFNYTVERCYYEHSALANIVLGSQV